MKKLSILLLALLSVTAFAQTNIAVNNNHEFNINFQKINLSHIFNPICKQASFIYQDHLVCLSNDGHAVAYPLFSTADSVKFDLESVPLKPHCNVANITTKKGKNYVYISSWDATRKCFVENVQWDKKTNTWTSKLVQTIDMNIDDSVAGKGPRDYVVDFKNKKIYSHTYTTANHKEKCYGNGIILMEFNLPDLSQKEVILTEKDVLRRTEYPMIYFTQDKEILDGKLYIIAGLRSSKKIDWDWTRKLVTINLKDLKINEIFDLSDHFDEPEGLDFYKGKWLLTYRKGTYEIKNKFK